MKHFKLWKPFQKRYLIFSGIDSFKKEKSSIKWVSNSGKSVKIGDTFNDVPSAAIKLQKKIGIKHVLRQRSRFECRGRVGSEGMGSGNFFHTRTMTKYFIDIE